MPTDELCGESPLAALGHRRDWKELLSSCILGLLPGVPLIIFLSYILVLFQKSSSQSKSELPQFLVSLPPHRPYLYDTI